MNLIFRLLGLIVIFTVLSTCSEEALEKNHTFNIEISDINAIRWASGTIRHQNYSNGYADYIVDTAYVVPLKEQGNYSLYFNLSEGDSLRIILAKYSTDFNFHSYDSIGLKNSIIDFIFNCDTLTIGTAALSLQPNTDENTFSAVVNASTSKGDFNGTVVSIPLVEKFY